MAAPQLPQRFTFVSDVGDEYLAERREDSVWMLDPHGGEFEARFFRITGKDAKRHTRGDRVRARYSDVSMEELAGGAILERTIQVGGWAYYVEWEPEQTDCRPEQPPLRVEDVLAGALVIGVIVIAILWAPGWLLALLLLGWWGATKKTA